MKPLDDATMAKETGRTRKDWFAFLARSKADGRAAIGKALLAEKVDAWWITVITVDYEAQAGIVEKDGRPKGYSLCVTKSVAAKPARVFKAFEAERDAWLGPKGALTVVKTRPDKAVVGSWDAPFAAGSKVDVALAPKGDGCGIVVNHTRVMTRGEADAVRASWDAGLAALKQRLES